MRLACRLPLLVALLSATTAALPLLSGDLSGVEERAVSYSVVAVDGGSSTSDAVEVETTTEVETVTETTSIPPVTTTVAPVTETITESVSSPQQVTVTAIETISASLAPTETIVSTAIETMSASPAPTETIVSTVLISGSDTKETVTATIQTIELTVSESAPASTLEIFSLVSAILGGSSIPSSPDAIPTTGLGLAESAVSTMQSVLPTYISTSSFEVDPTQSSTLSGAVAPSTASSGGGASWHTVYPVQNSTYSRFAGDIRNTTLLSAPTASLLSAGYESTTTVTSDPLPTLPSSSSASEGAAGIPAMLLPSHDYGKLPNPTAERRDALPSTQPTWHIN